MNAAFPAGPIVISAARWRGLDHQTNVINPARGGNNQSRYFADVDQESRAMLHLRNIECEANLRCMTVQKAMPVVSGQWYQAMRARLATLDQTFNEVGLAVKRATGGAQQPW